MPYYFCLFQNIKKLTMKNYTLATKIFIVLLLNMHYLSFGQSKNITEEQSNYYNSIGNANANYYEANTTAAPIPPKEKANCNLNKIVYGWHPYWSGSAYLNYDWSLLTHFSFFSYEVNPSTGNASDTHGWATSTAVNAALAAGVKVTLTVTLFSNHATFLGSPTAKQTLITNLINLIQARGAHGVCIDFEGIPASQKTNFANFMVSLSNQMHAAIPNSEVSTVLYAVDWNNVFDFTIMNPAVDNFVIMGYDYYWSGSTTAGPNDPLYHYSNTYNYSISRSITDYVNKGCPKNKLIMGLPYYGREWATSSSTIPSSATASGVSRTYAVVKGNASGNYTVANHQYENDSYTDAYVFNNGGTKQCFISLENSFRKRLDHINNSGIAGMGIWALGYDDGYNDLWNAIEDYMTDCYSSPCSGTVHDFGGPTKDYYNNENYTWTIAPDGASSLDFNFTSFNTENGYDFLYIYDGASTSSPQIAGSPFTGTNSPNSFTSSTGAVTFRFTSDAGTTAPGFVANYTCSVDNIAPVSSISTTGNWKTSDFTATFTDNDNTNGSGIDKKLYQILDFDGSDWRSNAQNGFFKDQFNQSSINTEWTSAVGSWNISNNALTQSDEVNGNTNLYATLNQDDYNIWMHEFSVKITGSGTNKRVGYHFMCDNATLPNRGNSYFIWLRVEDAKLQIYEVENDVFSLKVSTPYTTSINQWHNIKTVYNKNTGAIEVWIDNVFVSSWVDPTPLTTGNSISFRSGEAIMEVRNLDVYHERSNSEIILVGSTGDIRYQNTNPTTPSGKIKSVSIDFAKNVSVVASELINVDWTAPSTPTIVNDGQMADIFAFNMQQITGNWDLALDSHSGITQYEYSIGTAPLTSDIVDWSPNGLSLTFTTSTFITPLIDGETYYISVRAINDAGLVGTPTSSNGAIYSSDLGIEGLVKEVIASWPNPFNDEIKLSGIESENSVLVELLDLTGRRIYAIESNSSEITLTNLEHFTAGTYILKVISTETQQELYKRKIIKE